METSNGSGWIKIHRQITKWEWYTDSNTKSLFFHLLLMANHKPARFKGMIIETGCLITGQKKLSKETGLTVSQIRTSLNKLKLTNEIAIETTSQGTHIQVVKYADYQIIANDLAIEQRTTSERLATNKNEKNNKNEKKSVTQGETHNQYSFTEIKTQTLEQDLDIELFWSDLQKIYKPENDKGLFNSKAVKKQKSIIREFDKEAREKILEWFRKYKDQLKIGNPWISNFFTDKKTIEEVANYFRSIKNFKETKENKANNYGIKQTRNFDDYEITPKK